MRRFLIKSVYIVIGCIAVVSSGCQVGSRPRLRISDYFGSPAGMRFPEPDDLGAHCLDNCRGEKLGMVYTCKAGFIDIGHLREAADRTHYAAQIAYTNLMQTSTDYSFRIVEPARYHITLDYPDNWRSLPKTERAAVARDISVQLGQYLSHVSLIWHEILTWYGFSSAWIFPENISAFSIEDPYSDVLGTRLGAAVLAEEQCFYEEAAYERAMAAIITKTLQELDAQPSETARQAAEKVKGRWYQGGYYFFVEMKKRNLDVGFDDGTITPWRVPGICTDTPPQNCPVPGFGFLKEYGFRIKIRLRPAEFETAKVYAAAGLKRSDPITPYVHFPIIMESIRQEAWQRSGNNVDKAGE